jgi:nucleoside 2-deoxyribosyltransferase
MKIFLATPMEQLNSFEQQIAVQLQVLLNLKYGETSTFLAATEFPTPDTYLKPWDSYNFVVDFLQQADAVVLYYPRKVATGALVELGYALALGKRVVAVTHDEETLPYMVREGAPSMSIVIIEDHPVMWHPTSAASHLVESILEVL